MTDQQVITARVAELTITPYVVDTTSRRKIYVRAGQGVEGDRHYGPTRGADVRETWAQNGFDILNLRQLTITADHEQDAIANSLQIPTSVVNGLALQSNIVLTGFSGPILLAHLPFMAVMAFDNSTAVLILTGRNGPCSVVAERIAEQLGDDEAAKQRVITGFMDAADVLRGATAMVYASGFIKKNYGVRIYMSPDFAR